MPQENSASNARLHLICAPFVYEHKRREVHGEEGMSGHKH